MTALGSEYGAYLALILAGFLPNEVWRWLGVIFARGLDEDSEIVLWVRAVATAILTGVVGKLVLFAPGSLATVPLGVRLAAVALGMSAFFALGRSVLAAVGIGFLAFIAIRRSVFAGVIAGEIALVAGALLFAAP